MPGKAFKNKATLAGRATASYNPADTAETNVYNAPYDLNGIPGLVAEPES